ncbi:MAG: ATPase associated with various cellular 3 [Verrucomicrobiales bacterium]|nr:ATPase associated with various cellular 3 [Verrucomicrobiales bacterium]
MTPAAPDDLTARIAVSSEWVPRVREELHQVLVGQEVLVDRMFVALLTNGHILLEGVPGLAKTLTIRALAGTMDATFKRFQFTPDLLPADLLGTLIYNPGDGAFRPKLGPIFANLILADEINRSPAKVQSALLEAMQERQVTLGDTTYRLPDPFMVMATQNPIDQEGTYQLPEAQLDRFLLKIKVDYPTRQEERRILDLMGTSSANTETKPIIDAAQIIESRKLVNEVLISDPVKDYIVNLVYASRTAGDILPELKNLIRCGASPRGTISLALATRALAFLHGRAFVTPQDVKDLAHDVLRHRILVTYEAEAEGVTSSQIIDRLLSKVPVP